MESTTWPNFFTRYFAFLATIAISQSSPLIGQNVRNANPDEFPFIVSIGKMRAVNIEDRQFCTGTLISLNKVLTCAHCLFGESVRTTEIIVGSANLLQGRWYTVKSWKSFDMWKDNLPIIVPSLNDIAVITLNRNVDIPNISPAIIHPSIPKCNSKIKIAGWGVLEDSSSTAVMRTAELKITSNEECESSVGTVGDGNFQVTKNFFCSFASPFVLSTCGDSGAPIMNEKNQLVGLNIGACPNLEKFKISKESFPNEKKRNLHLHLTDEYVQFIDSLK